MINTRAAAGWSRSRSRYRRPHRSARTWSVVSPGPENGLPRHTGAWSHPRSSQPRAGYNASFIVADPSIVNETVSGAPDGQYEQVASCEPLPTTRTPDKQRGATSGFVAPFGGSCCNGEACLNGVLTGEPSGTTGAVLYT